MNRSDDHEQLADLYLVTLVSVELAGRWLDARTAAQQLGPFHVITAWNPGHERPGDDANAAANAALRADLEALGCSPIVALGKDPNSDHAEHSWAVRGLDDRAACALGARYGQWAVFRITAQEQTVLGCFGPWSRSRRF
jgi:Protein of unknown function (DUF3293)